LFSLPIRWTIGRKLQLLVFITLLPAFAVSGCLSLIDLYQRERLAIQERAARQAEDVADRVDYFVVAAERMLTALAEVPAVRDGDIGETTALLRRLRPQYRYYDNLIAIGPTGYVYASGQPLPDSLLYAGDKDYFRVAVGTGGLTVSGLLDMQRIDDQGLIIASPVWDTRSRSGGVVAVLVSAGSLQSFLSTEAPPEASVTVATFDGQVVSRVPDPRNWVGRYLSLAAISPEIPGHFSGVWEGRFLDDTPRVVAFDTAARAPWRVFVGIPSAQAYAPLGRSLLGGSLVFVFTFGFALATAIFFSRRIAAPLRRLAAAAHDFVGDRLPAPVLVQGQDEVAELGAAFNKMLADLSRHIDALSAMQAVREADRLKTELLASVSHELKTPLGSIKGFASALQQDDVALDRATQRDFLATIEADADRLTRLVEDLLDMSRIESGALRLEREPCSIVELINATLDRLQPLLGGHAVDVALSAGIPPILVDPARIEQVLYNLVDNAIKYSPTGTCVRICACLSGSDEPCLIPAAGMPCGSVVVAVEDEGIGIPPEQLERVFERFWRAESGRRRRASGTGLGLAICKGIVQAHEGHIWAENRPTGGCRVVFSLPLPTVPAAADHADQAPAVGALSASRPGPAGW